MAKQGKFSLAGRFALFVQITEKKPYNIMIFIFCFKHKHLLLFLPNIYRKNPCPQFAKKGVKVCKNGENKQISHRNRRKSKNAEHL